MAYRKIGIVGATGQVGQEIARALAEEGFEVVPFSRTSTTVSGIPTQPLGSLVGFDAIVSTVGHQGMDDQIPIIERAKRDGVKRFVPSEWGVDHRIVKSHFFEPKMKVFAAVEAAQFPDGWTALGCGFLDSVIPLFIKHRSGSSALQICGSGTVQYPFTVRYDLGRILAYTFKHPSDYKNSWLTIANDWLSLDELAQTIQIVSGTSFEIEHLQLDQSTPVLHLMEVDGVEGFSREEVTKELPVALSHLQAFVPVYGKDYSK